MESPMRAALLLMIRFLTIATIIPFFSVGLRSGSPGLPCKEGQKRALLMFKQDLKDPSNRLSSWTSDGDCCNWTGVVCDHLTGHVLKLRLTNPNSHQDYHYPPFGHRYISTTWLGGKINPSLLHLKHLNYLDLSYNNFQGMQIPRFLGSLVTLRYLNLSQAGFQGLIPPQLGNLTNLHFLSLSDQMLKVENLEWISGLSHLNNLDMSFVNLSKASNWLQAINKLPSLVELHMVGCQLDHIPPLPITNFTSLSVLDLSENSFDSLIPRWVFSLTNLVSLYLRSFQGSIATLPSTNTISLKEIGPSLSNLCKLKDLDLSKINLNGDVSDIFESLSVCNPKRIESLLLGFNNLSGHLTDGHVRKFRNLNHLDLSRNSISGLIPVSLGNLSSLTRLLISDNRFNGSLPEGIGQLRMLTDFDISYNSLEGIVSIVHFTHLTKLKDFNARGNSLTLKISQDWLPPFQLRHLWLDYWHLGPEFPMWLQTQTQLETLSLPNTAISDTIPTWLWSISSQLTIVNLSHNQLHGEIPDIVGGNRLSADLSSNLFNGSLPLVSSSVTILDLSNSSFSGSLFDFFCNKMDEPKNLRSLHLRDNLLMGDIPNCFMNWKELFVLNLKSNNLTGNIPTSIGYLKWLSTLQLHSNNLSGELPLSMKNCTSLNLVDLGQNKLSGSLPTWIGESLSDLRVLDMRSNKFQGHIPSELCQLKNLQVLDLAHNDISGTIPRCFNNFSAMATRPGPRGFLDVSGYYMNNVMLVTKGRKAEYHWSTLSLVTNMDLSNNMISGEIPEELTSLLGLQSLNLSENLLTGRMPSKIGSMKWLQSMDLSLNQLDGEIPQSVSSLTFLSYLNLSYNNFMGEIPKSTQLQSFDPSSFIGNELCGAPLNTNCDADRMGPPTVEQDGGGEYRILEDQWFYVSLGLGFFTGFWIVLGSLLVNMPWSIHLSRLLNRIVLKLYHVIFEYV